MGNLNKDKIEKDLQEIYGKIYSATGPLAKMMVDLLTKNNKLIEQSGQNVNEISQSFKRLQGSLDTVYKKPAITSDKTITSPTPTPSPSRSQPGGGSTPGLT